MYLVKITRKITYMCNDHFLIKRTEDVSNFVKWSISSNDNHHCRNIVKDMTLEDASCLLEQKFLFISARPWCLYLGTLQFFVGKPE